jgi:hypothetical protein
MEPPAPSESPTAPRRGPPPRLSVRKRLAFLAVVFAALLAFCEAISFVATGFLASKGVFYTPRPIEGYGAYLAERDPVLGWPKPGAIGEGELDGVGARVSPAFPDRAAAPPALAVYGDSFAYSADVGPGDAWPEAVARAIGRRVDNFGFGGFGSDQSLLRFLGNGGVDTAPVVVLTHLPENLLRNLNQYRSLLYGAHAAQGLGFKPRFILGADGELELVPIPEIPADELAAFQRHPERYLEHETFAPGAPAGALRRTFPFGLSLLRAVFHHRVMSEFAGEPAYRRFYDPAHPAGGTALTARILQRFHDTAVERGRTPLVVVLASGLDLAYHRKTGEWVYAPLIEELERLGVPHLDVGPPMLEAIGDAPLADFYFMGDVSRHNNERGYALIAEAVLERLRSDGLVGAGPASAPAGGG